MKCKECGGELVYADYNVTDFKPFYNHSEGVFEARGVESRGYELVCKRCGLVDSGPYTQEQKEVMDSEGDNIPKPVHIIEKLICYKCGSKTFWAFKLSYSDPHYIRYRCKKCRFEFVVPIRYDLGGEKME